MRTSICGRWRRAPVPQYSSLLQAGHIPGRDGIGTATQRPRGMQNRPQGMRMGREPPAHHEQIAFDLWGCVDAIHKLEFGLASDQCNHFIEGFP